MSSSPRYDWFDMKTILFNARPRRELERRLPSRLGSRRFEIGAPESRERHPHFREVLDCGAKRSATPLSHGRSRSIIVRHTTSESGAKATALQTLSRQPAALNLAKRLDCGAFTAAFDRPPNTLIFTQTL